MIFLSRKEFVFDGRSEKHSHLILGELKMEIFSELNILRFFFFFACHKLNDSFDLHVFRVDFSASIVRCSLFVCSFCIQRQFARVLRFAINEMISSWENESIENENGETSAISSVINYKRSFRLFFFSRRIDSALAFCFIQFHLTRVLFLFFHFTSRFFLIRLKWAHNDGFMSNE